MERLAVQQPLADRAYRAILDAICDGELVPGQRVTQDELAERLQVSRQPVLQAILLLKRQGFLRDSGRRGIQVAPLDPDFVTQLYELRSALDGAACRGAAARGAAEARLWGGRLIEEGRAAVRSGSIHAMIAADMRFHLYLHELSGNPLIAETAALHWQHTRRVMGVYLARYVARDAIWDEHAAILAAIAAGDADRAERLARQHADAAGANLRQVVETAPERAQRANLPLRAGLIIGKERTAS
jgi:DNA-binding GntR family transcriptional regulator